MNITFYKDTLGPITAFSSKSKVKQISYGLYLWSTNIIRSLYIIFWILDEMNNNLYSLLISLLAIMSMQLLSFNIFSKLLWISKQFGLWIGFEMNRLTIIVITWP